MTGTRSLSAIAVALAAAWGAFAAGDRAGGVVIATGDIEPGECRQGVPADILGPGVVRVFNPPLAIGCVRLSNRSRVLMAGDHQGCFYAVPEGVPDAGGPRCPLLELPHRRGRPIPLEGDRCVLPDAVRRAGRNADLVLSGQASAEVATVAVHYAAAGGGRGARQVTSLPLAGSRRCAARALIARARSLAAALHGLGSLLESSLPAGSGERRSPPESENRFAPLATPVRPGNLMVRQARIGRSAEGRPIAVRQFGDPSFDGEVLIVGCIHGTECAGTEIRPVAGCPVSDADIHKLGNLNPGGFALGTRLNARGVDLNRNFASGWKPIGRQGSPQHSGPRPFSEPETRIAARFIRWLRPEVTIWFHQDTTAHPYVRAWGASVPFARRFAQLAGISFRRLPWLAGTAPNWQNHRFPGTASFVVEFPPGPLSPRAAGRYGLAVVKLAREVATR